MPCGTAVDFDELIFFRDFCLERATILTCHTPIGYCRLYMSLAAESALVQPARLPRASSRLARAKVAAEIACARFSARLTEAGVGWRSSCAPIDCGANGPASGLPTDCRTASSNCAIWVLQGPACADSTFWPNAQMKQAATIRRFILCSGYELSDRRLRLSLPQLANENPGSRLPVLLKTCNYWPATNSNGTTQSCGIPPT